MFWLLITLPFLVLAQDIQPTRPVPCGTETTCHNITHDSCPIGYTLTFDQCEPPIIQCSSGYEWNGQSCIFSETTCPNGFYLEGTTCELLRTECPTGFEWNGYDCKPLDGGCPNDLELIGGRCLNTNPECPHNYAWNGTVCLRVVIVCPQNFVMRGSKCEQYEIHCPAYHHKVGDRCVRDEPVCAESRQTWNGSQCVIPLTCDAGYEVQGAICVRIISECPPGFVRSGDSCVRQTPECGLGQTLIDGKCVRVEQKCQTRNKTCQERIEVTTTPSPWDVRPEDCSNNFELYNGRCICRSGYILPNGTCSFCSPGYSWINGRCEAVDVSRCQPGYSWINGRCEAVDVSHCQPGYSWINGRCEAVDVSRCQPGYSWINGRCEAVDVSRCQPGYSWINGRCEAVDVSRCQPGYSWINGRCVWTGSSCQPGYTNQGGQCVKYCPSGSVDQNGVCVPGYPTERPPCAPQCPYGTVERNGQCVTVYPQCPQGTVERNGVCVSTYPTDSRPTCNPQCPQGTVERNGVCVPVYSTERPPCSCPSGTVYQNGECVRTGCPPGYTTTAHGTCVPIYNPCTGPGCQATTHPSWTNTPTDATITDRPDDNTITITTEDGESDYGTGSKTEHRTEKTGTPSTTPGHYPISCPPGYYNRAGVCVPRCPQDYESKGSLCIPTCPPEYESRNGICVRKVCPLGYDLRNGVCLPRCPDGYSLIDGACQPLRCPEGLILRNGICERCSSGFYGQNGVCVPVPIECPAGYVRSHENRCVPILQCPPHTYLQNGTCIHFGCPEGFYYKNEECHPVVSGKIEDIENDEEPIVTRVHNHNVIDHPINITNVNINTIGIYLGACNDGRIKAVIVRENGTETLNCGEDRQQVEEEEVIEPEGEKCCTVVGPRKCEKKDDAWLCYNRKKKTCGRVCTSDTVYLSPSRRDCNACIGGGYRCVTECYRAPSCEIGACTYHDYDQFCSTGQSELC